MAEENKKNEQLQDEQLKEANGGYTALYHQVDLEQKGKLPL